MVAETADERTIRLLNEEIARLRGSVGHGLDRERGLHDHVEQGLERERGLHGHVEQGFQRERRLHEDVEHGLVREQRLEANLDAGKRALQQRHMLMEEVNHRTKNSIQMAVALISLQMQSANDPTVKEGLENAVRRLGHVAKVHAMLCRQSQDQQSINFRDYLTSLCAELSDGIGNNRIRVVVDGDEIFLEAAVAVNLALIAGEAVTNALKHAFPDDRSGAILVECHSGQAEATMTITDDGVGMSGLSKDTLGMRLVKSLAEGIGGTSYVTQEHGTCVRVSFPLVG